MDFIQKFSWPGGPWPEPKERQGHDSLSTWTEWFIPGTSISGTSKKELDFVVAAVNATL